MKVIFDESFLSRAEQIDSTLTISSCAIGSYYNTVTNITDLISVDYYNNDTTKFPIDNNNLEGIWEEDKKVLQLSIVITENDKKESLSNSENNYNLIYVFYKEVGPDNEEKIAFILSGDITKKGNNYSIDPLNLSINKNLVQVVFPTNRTIQANIKANQGDDTSFLEGYGVEKGVNIFKATENTNSSTELTPKISYYKYLRNNGTGGDSEDLPYLNIQGERIFSYSYYYNYTDLFLETANTSIEGSSFVDRSLSNEGGEIQFYGTYKRTKYIIKDGVAVDYIEEEGNILDASDILLVNIENTGIDFEIDNLNKRIIYKGNTDSNSSFSSTFYITTKNYNPITKEVTSTNSKVIRLVQGAGNSTWNVISNTIYTEEGIKLYLFGPDADETQTFRIETNLEITNVESDITFSYEDDLQEYIEKYFDISAKTTSQTDTSTTITVTLKTLTSNEDSSKWFPLVDIKGEDEGPVTQESRLIAVTIIVKDSRSETFYLVQGPQVLGINLFRKISNNNYTKVTDELILQTGQKTILYPAKDVVKEENGNYWKLAQEINRVEVVPASGTLNEPDYTSWDDPESPNPYSITISTDERSNSINNKLLGAITFGRINSEESDIDFNNWRDSMTIGRCNLNVYVAGETPQIETDDEIVLDILGCYYFYVKSNCGLSLQIHNSSSYTGNVVFTDSDDLFTLEVTNHNNNTGVPIYLTFNSNRSNSDYDLGYITISPLNYSGSGSYEERIDIKVDNPTGTISYYDIDPKSRFIYFNPTTANSSISQNKNIKCNTTPAILYFPGQTSEQFINTTSNNIFSGIRINKSNANYSNRGYVYSTIQHGLNFHSINNSWPAKYLGSLRVFPINNHNNNIYFYDFILGPKPNITVDGTSTTSKYYYLKPESDSYVNFSVTSRLSIPNLNRFNFTNSSYNSNNFIITSYRYTQSDGSYKYEYRVRSLRTNTSPSSTNIGYFLLESQVTPDQFINDQSGIPSNSYLPNLTQDEINDIVAPKTVRIYIYQRGNSGSDIISVTPPGSQTVGPMGNFLYYTVNGPSSKSVVLVNNTPTVGFVSYSSVTNKITYNVRELSSTPINISTAGDLSRYKSTYWDDFTNIGFTATITNTVTSQAFNYTTNSIIRRGFKYALVYGTPQKSQTLYFISDINNITETVSGSTTTFSFYIGVFNYWTNLVEEDGGILPTLESVDGDIEITSKTPIYRTGNQIPVEYNVTATFPKNTSAESVTRRISVHYFGNTFESFDFYINITQAGRETQVISSIGNAIYFHSSGHCIMDSTELDVADPKLETNINREELEISSDLSDLIEDWSLDYVGPSSIDGYTQYKLKIILSPNKGTSTRSGTIYMMADGVRKQTWNIHQGYLNLYVTDPEGNKISGDGSVGSEGNAFSVPASNNLGSEGSGRVIFPFSASNREYDSSGTLGEEFTFNKEDFSIRDFNWTISNLSPSTVFTEYNSEYVIEDNQFTDKVPFIEQTYTTNSSYINQEVPFIATVNLFYNYPEPIDEESTDYIFTFYMKKVSIGEVTITTDPSGPIQVNTSEADKVEFTVSCNIDEYSVTITEGSSWIHRNEEETKPEDDFYSFNIDANPTESPRNGTITISAGGTSITVEITQVGIGTVINV